MPCIVLNLLDVLVNEVMPISSTTAKETVTTHMFLYIIKQVILPAAAVDVINLAT